MKYVINIFYEHYSQQQKNLARRITSYMIKVLSILEKKRVKLRPLNCSNLRGHLPVIKRFST